MRGFEMNALSLRDDAEMAMMGQHLEEFAKLGPMISGGGNLSVIM